jgi:GNAT superfamily N-acetyltransferase
MELIAYTSAADFLADLQSEMEKDEAANSLILGLARAMGDSAAPDGEGRFFGAIREQDRWPLIAFMTPPRPLGIAATPECPRAAHAMMAEHLHGLSGSVSGVVAAPHHANAFAEEWRRITGCGIRRTMRQRLYGLTAVASDLNLVRGTLRRATTADLELVGNWFAAFNEEAVNDTDHARARSDGAKRLEKGMVYLWDDGTPGGMVAWSRPTRRTVTVNAVYTPPERRRQGIATAAVAQLSRMLLGEGYGMCVLYTDLANPTSNAIYQRIGYRPVCDSLYHDFEPTV